MTVTRKQPVDVIEGHIDESLKQGRSLLDSSDGDETVPILERGYRSWDGRNQVMLDSGFSVSGFMESGPKQEYCSFVGLKYPFGPEASEDVTEDDLRSDIRLKLSRLETIRGQLGFYAAAEGVDPVGMAPDAAIGADTIFLVHGRDDAVRLSVEVVFSKCVSSPYTILGEQVNGGMTIIEKLEAHLGQRANYAVILMTGDDEGALKGESPKPRARQNVVLELGYAMAALGRQRVCVLCSTGLELPSDVSGVTYIPLDEPGAWKLQLLAELSAAGFDVDANKLLSSN